MKYWLLTTEYPPQYGGGIGTYCYQWCSLLKRNDDEVTIFIPDKNVKTFNEIFQDNLRVVYFSPYLKDTSSFLGYETMVSSSFEKIVHIYLEKEGVPDWLEAQEYNGIAYFILQKKHLDYALFHELKVLITCHCPSFITFEHNHINTYQLPYFWIGEMERFCMKSADICISPSKYLIKKINDRYPGLISETQIIHNPYQLKNKVHQAFDSDEIVFIGKLSPAKGILQTIRVFDKLWSNGFSYKLKLIGDQHYFYHAIGKTMEVFLKQRYSRYIQSDLLIIAGMLSPEKLQEEVDKAKIVLVPSTVENLPYTVIECMGMGKVVLSSKQGGQCEIIEHAINGFLFDYEEPSSLEKMLQYVSSLNNEELLGIGEAAKKTIEKKCNPEDYYIEKMKCLEKAVTHSMKRFPFIHNSSDSKEFLETERNEKDALLSVIIPYYNMSDYLMETLNSINDSEYKNIEIIIVNDGSNNAASIDFLKNLKPTKNIKILHQSNEGLASARNCGAKEAKGDYLAFLDPDDKVASTYFSKAIHILKNKKNIHFVGCWVQYFENSLCKWPTFNPEPPYLLFHNMINSSSLVYKRLSFLKGGINDSRFIYGMEDFDSVIGMVEKGLHGVVIPEFLFYYRVRKDSMARGFNKNNTAYLYQLLAEKHKRIYGTFATEIACLLNANGPGLNFENPTLDYHIYKGNSLYSRIIRKGIRKIKQYPMLRKIVLSIYHKKFN